MKNCKICVYAICKNEEKFVERWLDSMNEADYICVLDTGSTDNTVKLLKKNPKVIVKSKKISPWRFDSARNESLKLIPKDTDFCVCTDLDEVFEKDWRKKIEQNVKDDTGIVQYRYTWNFNDDGSEGIVFFGNKIHKFNKYFWKHPVHEVITPKKNTKLKTIVIPSLQLNHYADNNKSRSQYLELLELSIKEDPYDDRNVHYLGREYFFYRQYNKAILTLKKHLSLPTATWKDERSSSLRIIAKCYMAQNKPKLAIKYFKQSIIEKPDIREGYYWLGLCYYFFNKFQDAILTFLSMKNIYQRNLNYMSEPDCWSNKCDDILSVCFYNLGDIQNAIEYCKLALKKDPDNVRLQKNLILMYEKLLIKNN